MSAQPQTKPATGTETVTVASKIPQGLILQLFKPREIEMTALGGSQKATQFFPTGDEFTIAGAAHPQNEGPRCRTVGGFAITDGVPKSLWDAWMEQTGRYLPAVINKMIFAFPNSERATDAAKDHRTVLTGLERINPNKPPVLDPRFQIKTSDDQKAIIGHVEE
jgi:hypothetical protein